MTRSRSHVSRISVAENSLSGWMTVSIPSWRFGATAPSAATWKAGAAMSEMSSVRLANARMQVSA